MRFELVHEHLFTNAREHIGLAHTPTHMNKWEYFGWKGWFCPISLLINDV